MATKTIAWSVGSGNITLTYQGQGNGTIIVQSDPNNLYEARSANITVKTNDGNIEKVLTIIQAARVKINISSAIVTASDQTYNGSSKTPTPTVTLDGTVIPSSGYDVSYTNNINAGIATITVTGKGDYTGVATGTFVINKATPTYTAPTYNDWTYDGYSHYLVTAGSTNHGTIQFSTDNSSWSTTRPTQTNAGVYYTYWRLIGDSNHTDISSTSIRTDVSKASRTISFNNISNSIAIGLSITNAATVSAGSSDGTLTYSSSNSNYVRVTNSGVVTGVSSGSVTITASITAGTNYKAASGTYTIVCYGIIKSQPYSGLLKSDGTVDTSSSITSQGYKYSDYIEIPKGVNGIYCNQIFPVESGWSGLCLYNSNKTCIGTAPYMSNKNGQNSTVVNLNDYSGAKYVRYSKALDSSWNSYIVFCNITLDSKYGASYANIPGLLTGNGGVNTTSGITSQGYKYSDYISIPSGCTQIQAYYTFPVTGDGSWSGLHIYNSSKTFLGNGQNLENYNGHGCGFTTLSSFSNPKYIRFSPSLNVTVTVIRFLNYNIYA